MGKVLSIAVGKAKRFNVENRAHRVISQDKPVAAPKYEANVKDLERMLKDHPEFVEQASKKSSVLDERLKQVFVTSSDYLEQRRYIDPEKPLPLSRAHVADFELGYQETDVKRVPLGKCTLRQAIHFISEHQQKPDEVTAEKIANEFKLKQETVDDILEHFRMFAIHIPEVEGKTKKYLIDPFHSKSSDFEKVLAESRSDTKK